MERGRTNYLRLLGADQRALFAEAETEAPGFAFVVRSMKLEFLRPAHMDDLLDIVTRPVDVRGASITLHQEIRRGAVLLLEADVKVAFVSGGRAKPIPKALLDKVLAAQTFNAGFAAVEFTVGNRVFRGENCRRQANRADEVRIRWRQL